MAASALSSENTVKKIYQTVIDEVLENIREAFLDEGYDEQLLQDLKQMWETKLNASRAVQTSDDTNTVATSSASENTNINTASTLRLPVAQPNKEQASIQHKTNQTYNPNNQLINNNLDVKSGIHMTDPSTRAALQALPPSLYSTQSGGSQDMNNQKLKKPIAAQLDGGVDGSSSDEDEDINDIVVGSIHGDDEDDDDEKTNNEDPSEYEGKEDPDPLNSEDDLTEPGTPDSNSDLFDTEHVIVCQYDKITRIKNKWKFHLKDGIMNINGRDYLFSKANGDAEW